MNFVSQQLSMKWGVCTHEPVLMQDIEALSHIGTDSDNDLLSVIKWK
jgi:hypothetical protein